MALLTPAIGLPSPGQTTITGFITLTLPTFIETSQVRKKTEGQTADTREDLPQDKGRSADAAPARPEGFVQSEEYAMRESNDGEKTPVILNTVVPR
jgi:hypothetical protein